MIDLWRSLSLAIVLGLLVARVVSAQSSEPPTLGAGSEGVSAEMSEAERKETFRAVWSTVNDAHFDETFGGVDWRAVGERYSNRLPEIGSNDELRQLLHAMLAELRQSHFAIIPREAVVFTQSERNRVGTTGIDVDYIEGDVVVTRVRQGSAGERAGLKVGSIIRAIGGLEVEALDAAMQRSGVSDRQVAIHLSNLVRAQLGEGAGTTIEIQGSEPGGRCFAAQLTSEAHDGVWSEPLGNFPSMPLEYETRRDDGMALLRFSAFSPALMKQMRAFLRGLQKDDGLIIDLRGNPGGVIDMASGIAGLLIDRQIALGAMRLRKGSMQYIAYPQERAFSGPLAILIDGQSASTSEILAAGLRDHGRARLFGERTAGAALPSAFRALPNGDLLQYALGDVRTPRGATIEGNGVEPDVVLKRTRSELGAERDAVLEAAKAWLAAERRARGMAPAAATAERP